MSRGEAEKAIQAGRVSVDGMVTRIRGPVGDCQSVEIDGVAVPAPPAEPRLWGLVKPRGVFPEFTRKSGHRDEPPFFIPDLLGRWEEAESRTAGPGRTENLPNHFTVVNRAPVMAHGLILLTTDGLFASALSRDDSKVLTTFRVRTPPVTDSALDELRKWRSGIGLPGTHYGSVFIDVDRRTPTQTWLKIRLVANRERDLGKLLWYRAGIRVNRINVYAFGPYRVTDIPERQVIRLPIDPAIAHLVPGRQVKPQLIHRQKN